MDMQMIDALATVLTGVDHGSIAGFGNSLLTCEGGRERYHLAEEIRIGEIVERADVLFRDDQNVGRCLRIDVAKRDDLFAVDDQFRGCLTPSDLTENAILRLSHPGFFHGAAFSGI